MFAGQDISFGQALGIAGTGFLVVLLELAFIAVMVLLLSKAVRFFENRLTKSRPAAQIPDLQPAGLPSNMSQGTLMLENVDEPTAAVIMAVVSHQSGIPLNRLEFVSIREVESTKAGELQ